MMKKMAPVSDRRMVIIAVDDLVSFGRALLGVEILARQLANKLNEAVEQLNEKLPEIFKDGKHLSKWIVIQTETITTLEESKRIMTCTAICELRPYQP